MGVVVGVVDEESGRNGKVRRTRRTERLWIKYLKAVFVMG
jgi:hypothetical protein